MYTIRYVCVEMVCCFALVEAGGVDGGSWIRTASNNMHVSLFVVLFCLFVRIHLYVFSIAVCMGRTLPLQWADTNFSTPWCYENFVQVRSMKRARDVREQILKLLERTEVVMQSNPTDFDAIKKVLGGL
jgi:hypothetical protein